MDKFSPCGLIGLGPMAGPGDSGFRRICRENGADYTVSEMISAKAIRFGASKTLSLAKHTDAECPFLVQLFGREPESIEYAASYISENVNPAGIDINMGCPAPKIFNNGEGSALLREPSLAYELVKSAVKSTSLPISVKMRIGIDSFTNDIIDFAKRIQDAGASFLTIHGRTREQFYSGTVNYDSIRRIKEAVSIPVVANGDISDGPSAMKALEITGADGIMIARGALGSPDVFGRIKCFYMTGEESLLDLEERFRLCLAQLRYTIEDKGEEKGCIEFRKHMLWYLKGVSGAGMYKVMAGQMSSYRDCESLICRVIEDQKNRPFY